MYNSYSFRTKTLDFIPDSQELFEFESNIGLYSDLNSNNNSSIFLENNINSFNNQGKERNETNKYLGKKIKFLSDNINDSTIFKLGTFDSYSKKMINKANQLIEEEEEYRKNKKNVKKKREINPKKEKIDYEKSRKYDTDLIRSKSVPKLIKSTTNKVNIKLKMAKSKRTFRNLPPKYIKIFISDILKAKKEPKGNVSDYNLTLENIYSKEFYGEKEEKEEKEKKKKNSAKNKLKHNKEVLDYLKENPIISEKSKFNVFKNMKFSEIFRDYLNSPDFEMDIFKMKYKYNKEKDRVKVERDEYILNYIIKTMKFLKIFPKYS
jgi:hypothetical protein